MYATNNLDIALVAQESGVDRIWIDLEIKGKAERQKNMDTLQSHHSVEDIKKIAPRLTTSKMLVRINPWDNESEKEIENVIAAGADIIMLPMWKTADEVYKFIRAVNKRTRTILLLETREANECLDEVLTIPGIDEIHIGLNDLHLSYGLSFMFEPLVNGMVEKIIDKIRAKGIPYGFGGVSHLGDGLIPAEMLIIEHYRLGSSLSILSRGFCDQKKDIQDIKKIFTKQMSELRSFEKTVNKLMFEDNRKKLQLIVEQIVQLKKETK